MNDETFKNGIFIVSCNDGSLTLRSGSFIQNALEGINKLTIKKFASVSDLNTCY